MGEDGYISSHSFSSSLPNLRLYTLFYAESGIRVSKTPKLTPKLGIMNRVFQ
jgi:hypothetical protein